VKKLIASLLLVTGMLAGPLTSAASANPLFCQLAAKLGYEWVKECE
jgi:hypothetical protein